MHRTVFNIQTGETQVVPLTPEEIAEIENKPTPVPSSVTMRQARLALLQQGLLSQVEQALATLTGTEGEAARIEWEYASGIERNSALVTQITAGLGLTEAEVDDLFRLANSL